MDSAAPDAGRHLVLDVGALAIDAGPGRDGTEIEISPAGSQQRVPNVVRRRPAGPLQAARDGAPVAGRVDH